MLQNLRRIAFTCLFLFCLYFLVACQANETATPETAVTDIPTAIEKTAAPATTIPETKTPAIETVPDAEEMTHILVSALMELYLQPNRMEVTTTPEGGQAQTNLIEFIPPDRKHIADLAEKVEYIVIGEKVYLYTDSSKQWEETQIPGATFLSDPDITEKGIAATITNPQFLRHDIVDGISVQVFSYQSTTNSGDIELHSQTEIWVGTKDGLPYKMIIIGEILAASTDPQTGESSLKAVQAQTTMSILFDETIQIEPPIP